MRDDRREPASRPQRSGTAWSSSEACTTFVLVNRGCVLTIGVFDGVHVGHRALLERLAGLGEDFNLPSTLMVFEPHPQEVLDYLVTPARITGLREKVMALRGTPVDRVLCVRFDEKFATMGAREFIEDLLDAKLGVRHLVVGDDFRFGHQAEGDIELLRAAGPAHGFEVHRRDTYQDRRETGSAAPASATCSRSAGSMR